MTIRRTAACMLLLLAAGCSFLKRPDNHFYSLDVVGPVNPVAGRSGVPVALAAVELPPGLDRREVVVRGANHEIEVRGTQQWTTPLGEMALHTLAFDLARRLPDGMMVLPGQPKPAAAVRSLSVVLEDLAPGSDRVFVLDARWALGTPGAASRAGHERITVTMDSMESPAIATAMSNALATLADRLAAQL
jgi:uncharacterized lipoprotein YmbA